MEKIAILENAMEAKILEDVLLKENIEFNIHDYNSSAFPTLYQQGHGWGHVESDPENASVIIKTLENIRNNPPDHSSSVE